MIFFLIPVFLLIPVFTGQVSKRDQAVFSLPAATLKMATLSLQEVTQRTFTSEGASCGETAAGVKVQGEQDGQNMLAVCLPDQSSHSVAVVSSLGDASEDALFGKFHDILAVPSALEDTVFSLSQAAVWRTT